MFWNKDYASDGPATGLMTDYHTHSTYSVDGRSTPEAMCREAVKRGMSALAITEHAEWARNQNGHKDPDGYWRAMARCRLEFEPRGVQVLTGVELGNPHEHAAEASALLDAYPYDVRIASLHWLYGENIHDTSVFSGREPDTVFADYFTALGRMAADFDFDVVAHFDRIIWRAMLVHLDFDPLRLEDPIRDAMQSIVDNGRIIELNTRNVGQWPGWDRALLTMLRWYREAGGSQVVVNSDAHHVSQLQRNAFQAVSILEDAGLGRPATLSPRPVPTDA